MAKMVKIYFFKRYSLLKSLVERFRPAFDFIAAAVIFVEILRGWPNKPKAEGRQGARGPQCAPIAPFGEFSARVCLGEFPLGGVC